MNAIQPLIPPLQPVETPQRSPRRSRTQRRYPHQELTIEIAAKLVVNGVLCTAAVAALIQLVPYNLSQQAKLQEITGEVKRTEKRVNGLSQEISRSFDPSESKSVMQEQSHRVSPGQLPVVLQDNETSEDESDLQQ